MIVCSDKVVTGCFAGRVRASGVIGCSFIKITGIAQCAVNFVSADMMKAGDGFWVLGFRFWVLGDGSWVLDDCGLFSQCFLADSSKLNVPVIFVSINSLGPCIDLSTWDSAAKWTTLSTSYFSKTLQTSSKLQISTCLK